MIGSERPRVVLGPLVARALADGGAEEVVGLARRHRGPIVEATADRDTYAVTFVFADHRAEAGAAAVVCPALPGGAAWLRPLGGHVFAGTQRLPRGARATYHFHADPASLDGLAHVPAGRRLDRCNPATDRMAIPELRLLLVESVLTLPGAAPAPWSEPRAGVAAGAVVTETIRGEVLGGDRRVTVYQPPGPTAGALPLVVLLDGQHAWWRAPVVFDNLIAGGAAVPFLAVLVGVGRFSARLRELAGSPRHVRFLAGELLPWLRSRWPVAREGHVLAGFSAGAVAAAYAALAAPDLFPRLIALSGSYHLTTRSDPLHPAGGAPWLVAEYGRAHRLPARAYLAAGRFEPDAHRQTAALADVLLRRGVSSRFDSVPAGHDAFTARAGLADGLAWMLGP